MNAENKPSGDMNKTIIFIVTIIIVGAGAFYGGTNYQKSKGGGMTLADLQKLPAAERRQQLQTLGLFSGGNSGGRGAGGTGRQGGVGFVSGKIIAKTDKSITVASQDNGSKIIFLSGSTEITKSASGTPADLAVGQQVVINGTANSDGSVTANMIQLRPQFTRPAQ